MKEVKSSNIDSIGCKGNNLYVRFKNGSLYEYKGASMKYDSMLASDSKGKFLYHEIKGKYDYRKVEEKEC